MANRMANRMANIVRSAWQNDAPNPNPNPNPNTQNPLLAVVLPTDSDQIQSHRYLGASAIGIGSLR